MCVCESVCVVWCACVCTDRYRRQHAGWADGSIALVSLSYLRPLIPILTPDTPTITTQTDTFLPSNRYDPVTSTEVFYSIPSLPADAIKYDDAKPPVVSDRVRFLCFVQSAVDGRGCVFRWIGLGAFELCFRCHIAVGWGIY